MGCGKGFPPLIGYSYNNKINQTFGYFGVVYKYSNIVVYDLLLKNLLCKGSIPHVSPRRRC